MRFGLSEEQELLQETVRGFIAGECPTSRLREIFDGGQGQDESIWKGMAEMGLAGLVVPEAYGGAGMQILDLALVCEVAGGGALPGPLLGHALTGLAIATAGTTAQKEQWLPRLAAGELIGTIAFGEDAAWAPETWTVAESQGRLRGAKTHVPHALLADLFVVGTAGGGLAIAPRAEGLTTHDQDGIDRTRPIGEVLFEDAPCEPLPGGCAAAALVRDTALACIAADSFGAATRLVQVSADYAKDRTQFGFPIGQFQSVKHQIARIGTDIEPTRALFWYAAHAQDQALEDRERAAAMAKAHITDRGMHAAREAVELHGGLGFTWECDVQIWFKRAMFNRAYLGTPEEHRERSATLAGW